MNFLTFLSQIVENLAWPIFFLVIFLNSKKLALLVRQLIESIPKSREVDIKVGKASFKIVPKDVEDRINTLKLEMKNLVPEIIIPSSVPYVDRDIESLVKQLLSLETFNIQIDNIKDPDLLSIIGSYYFMSTNISQSLKYYHLAESNLLKDNIKLQILYSNLGFVYFYKCDYMTADSYFRKSLHISDEFPWGHLGLALLGKTVSDFSTIANVSVRKAIVTFRKAIEIRQADFMLYFGLSHVYMLTKNYEMALKNLKISTEINKRFAIGFYNMAIAKLAIDHDAYSTDDAIKDFIEAIILQPNLKEFAISDTDINELRDHRCYKCLIR